MEAGWTVIAALLIGARSASHRITRRGRDTQLRAVIEVNQRLARRRRPARPTRVALAAISA
jgi:hypothetical protein